MCHHVDHREWTFEDIGADEDGSTEEPEDREPSLVEPGDPEVSPDRAYDSPTGDD